jgi:hypothetical protein
MAVESSPEPHGANDLEVEKGAITHHDASEKSISPPESSGENAKMTAKTWFVIFILTSTFGLSFWPVPTTAAMQATLGARWGTPTAIYWFSKLFRTCYSSRTRSNTTTSSCIYDWLLSWFPSRWFSQ